MRKALITVVVLVGVFLLSILLLGTGWLLKPWGAGDPTTSPIPNDVALSRQVAQREAARQLDAPAAKQILFGDLHVHTTYSTDAFLMALPFAGGNGAHPIADACDFARFCSALDFWSINDHAIALTPARWRETIDEIRQCNAVGSDTTAFLGWEWTQIGSSPENHYGHKNVIIRDLEDDAIPARPIATGPPPGGVPVTQGGNLSIMQRGVTALRGMGNGGPEFARYIADTQDVPTCPSGVPVRDLPADCRELASTPGELFAKLADWDVASLVIPHGTTWGMYTPLGSSWDKQLTPENHDPDRQRLIEVFSGHGNSEEYRDFREVILHPDGQRECPPPQDDYLPACWQAGEIIRARCIDIGDGPNACDARAADARQFYVDTDRNANQRVVPGSRPEDWLEAGACPDCFQGTFNYRPRSSAQYILSLGKPEAPGGFERFRLGFIASSDNHSARPGTGYKEVARTSFTEARFGRILNGLPPMSDPPSAEPIAFDAYATSNPVFGLWEFERASSYFLNGGLVATHALGRDRAAVWDALQRREVYGTSGTRILLWFDLVDAGERLPMGSSVELGSAPSFEVRAVGSFEQQPGCPAHARDLAGFDRLEQLCRGECYNPGSERRLITRIEVVRITPRTLPDESPAALIADPWRVYDCPADPAGCRITFTDDEFEAAARDSVYYVRAIEAPSEAVGVEPVTCRRDPAGRCLEVVSSCATLDDADDCLAETEERAWSSPIYVDWPG